jgi:Flp pilus assembly pilin Flp
MKIRDILKKRKGQGIIEYAIILGLIVAALSAMRVYIKRGIQAGIKVAADQLGSQENAEETDLKKGGRIVRANIDITTESEKKLTLLEDGTQEREIADETRSYSIEDSVYLMGLEEE